MGKPTAPAGRPAADAVSLHDHPNDSGSSPFFDDDAPQLENDDLPPLYSEEDAAGSSTSAATAPLLPSFAWAGQPPITPAFVKTDANTGTERIIDERLEQAPDLLEQSVRHWAAIPPRPYVKVKGTHKQRRQQNNKKDEERTVTDFDVWVDLTPHLFSDAMNMVSWTQLRTIENGEPARRGTALRKRAPGYEGSIALGEDPKPSLQEWCHRFCASHAGLKVFTLQRHVVGFDQQKVREKLLHLVRATNYRGCVEIAFPVNNASVEVYNDAKTNVWRLTAWVWWLVCLTMLWIFTWPYLFFRTKRFEVAVAEWPFSRMTPTGKQYISVSEDQWYNMWGRAIHKAVLQRRQGVLDQNDLLTANDGGPTIMTGNAILDGGNDLLRTSVSAMNAINLHAGWGFDS